MAFSSVWEGGGPNGRVWVDAPAGMVLVAVSGGRSGIRWGALTPPPGWSLLGWESQFGASGDLQSPGYEWCAIYWRIADGSATDVFFGSPAADPTAGRWTVIYGFAGPRALSGWAIARPQAQRPWWPAVAGGAGDAVRISLLPGHSGAPPGTDRAGSPWLASIQVRDQAVAAGGAAQVQSSSSSPGEGVTWTLLLAGAQVPTPVLTGASAVEIGGALGVSWAPSAGQTARAVRRRLGNGSWSYLNAAGSWVGTVQWVTSGVASASLSSWSAGTYQVQVAVRVGSDDSEWSQSLSVKADSPPPAPSSVVVAPTNVRRPTVTVTGAAGAGGTVTGYRIEVRDPDDVLVEAGWADASGIWTATTRWPDSVSVAAQTVRYGGLAGPWTTVAVTLVVPPVPTPVVDAVGVEHPDSGLPGVRLVVTATGTYTLEVQPADGDVLTGVMTDSTTVDDYSPAASYRVRLVRADGEVSEWVTVPAAAVAAGQAQWLVDPQRPETAVLLRARSDDEHVWDLRASTARYLDDDIEQVSYAGPPMAPSGTSTVWAVDRPALEAALALLRSRRPLRYRWPPSSRGEPGRLDEFLPIEVSAPRFVPDVNHDIWAITYRWATARTTTARST